MSREISFNTLQRTSFFDYVHFEIFLSPWNFRKLSLANRAFDNQKPLTKSSDLEVYYILPKVIFFEKMKIFLSARKSYPSFASYNTIDISIVALKT